MICTRLRPGHLSERGGDSSRRCEEIVKKKKKKKKSRIAPLNAIIIISSSIIVILLQDQPVLALTLYHQESGNSAECNILCHWLNPTGYRGWSDPPDVPHWVAKPYHETTRIQVTRALSLPFPSPLLEQWLRFVGPRHPTFRQGLLQESKITSVSMGFVCLFVWGSVCAEKLNDYSWQHTV